MLKRSACAIAFLALCGASTATAQRSELVMDDTPGLFYSPLMDELEPGCIRWATKAFDTPSQGFQAIPEMLRTPATPKWPSEVCVTMPGGIEGLKANPDTLNALSRVAGVKLKNCSKRKAATIELIEYDSKEAASFATSHHGDVILTPEWVEAQRNFIPFETTTPPKVSIYPAAAHSKYRAYFQNSGADLPTLVTVGKRVSGFVDLGDNGEFLAAKCFVSKSAGPNALENAKLDCLYRALVAPNLSVQKPRTDASSAWLGIDDKLFPSAIERSLRARQSTNVEPSCRTRAKAENDGQ